MRPLITHNWNMPCANISGKSIKICNDLLNVVSYAPVSGDLLACLCDIIYIQLNERFRRYLTRTITIWPSLMVKRPSSKATKK